MNGVEALVELGIAIAVACAALQVPRASYYRRITNTQQPNERPGQRPRSHRALSEEEVEEVHRTLVSKRFRDQAPRQVYHTLLEEGVYLCSPRTMYRILDANKQLIERRQAARGKPHPKPELAARSPNEVWSWDITKLKTFQPGVYLHLYVIIDIFSRYVVGWTVSTAESARLAVELIEATADKQEIQSGQLTLHSDRGASMKSNSVGQLLVSLGVDRSHSRPRVSNDNPFSEAQFKTVKYDPDFPERFADQDHAWAFCTEFFAWYNDEHHHSGIAGMTPFVVHHGLTDDVLAKRDATLAAAYREHPERFPAGPPRSKRPPSEVYINRPSSLPELKEAVANSDSDEQSEYSLI